MSEEIEFELNLGIYILSKIFHASVELLFSQQFNAGHKVVYFAVVTHGKGRLSKVSLT